MSDRLPFSSRQAANMLAARAVRHAGDFLQGKDGPRTLGLNADALHLELLLIDPAANGLLNPVRMLNVAMMSTARAAADVQPGDAARLDRWMHVMGALVELVQHERARFATEHARERVGADIATGADDGASA